jgi:hypothetical protein
MKIKIRNVRLAFPELFKAVTVNGEGDPAYSACFLLPKDHPDLAAIREAVKTLAVDKWKDQASANMKSINANQRGLPKDGDTKAEYAGFEGMLYINARNKKRPDCRDRAANPVSESDGVFYSGCYVDAILDLWAQDNKYGKRINASLLGVQFRKDGEPLTSGGRAEDSDFETLEDDTSETMGDFF